MLLLTHLGFTEKEMRMFTVLIAPHGITVNFLIGSPSTKTEKMLAEMQRSIARKFVLYFLAGELPRMVEFPNDSTGWELAMELLRQKQFTGNASFIPLYDPSQA